jgi:hypothetical protein
MHQRQPRCGEAEQAKVNDCQCLICSERTQTDRVSTSRKGSSPTQPGRGIRKIVDLYHDLPDLVEKANKHSASIPQSEREEMDSIEFAGLSEEEIEDKHKEYVSVMRLVHVTYM